MAATSSESRITFNLDEVRDLEMRMTEKMPRSWIEDMMFIKANNNCVPTGINHQKPVTKEIHLHYGSKTGDDEWRSVDKKPRITQTVSKLLRKIGESNFNTVFTKIRNMCYEDTKLLDEFVETLVDLAESQPNSQVVLARVASMMRTAHPSFGHPVFTLRPPTTPNLGMWVLIGHNSDQLNGEAYEGACNLMLKTFREAEDQMAWAPVFEKALQGRDGDAWKERLQFLLTDSSIPLPMVLRLEDFLE